MADFRQQLKLHYEAEISAVYVETSEWARFADALEKVHKECGQGEELVFWDPSEEATDGPLFRDILKQIASDDSGQTTVVHLAESLWEVSERGEASEKAAQLAGVVSKLVARKKGRLFLVSPNLSVPGILQRDIAVLHLPLPGREEIKDILHEVRERFELDEECVDDSAEILDSVRGLGSTEIWNAFAKTAKGCGQIMSTEISELVLEKEQIIRKSGYLESVRTEKSLSDIGGLENLQEWLQKRKIAFGQKARDFHISAPRGILLLGIPGTGKSLSAKAVASTWKMPLLRLDMGSIYGGLLGQSEANMRNAIKTAESLAPCILWVDEIEKGISHGGERDGGAAQRVFGHFLTWMQEKDKEVFVFATANDISRLPPEFLRKGRFDEVFFVDLPDREQCAAIFGIHLKAKGRSKKPTGELLDMTELCTGAEIESIVNEAILMALNANPDDMSDITQHLFDAAKKTVPMAASMREQIDKLRAMGARYQKASKCEPPPIEAVEKTVPMAASMRELIQELRVMRQWYQKAGKGAPSPIKAAGQPSRKGGNDE